MKKLISALLLLFAIIISAEEWNPKPNEKNVILIGNARFTLLTERLIRMEYSVDKTFQDAATFTFVNRYTPDVPHKQVQSGDWWIISTRFVEIRYNPAITGTFSTRNLVVSIELNGNKVIWTPEPTWNRTSDGNLFGTVRTLDMMTMVPLDCYLLNRPDLHCTLGLISTKGIVVVDDTRHPIFNDDPWPWVVNNTYPVTGSCSIDQKQRRDCGYRGIPERECRRKGCCWEKVSTNGVPYCYYSTEAYQDLYLFGYGHDYQSALKEFTYVAGKIPIPPRYALGVFYSRWWAYSDIESMEIVNKYEQHGIPLDVLVTDMDWHLTFYKDKFKGVRDQAGQPIGWTGFTWDPKLFPNPKKFLQWLKTRGIKSALNLHPASGMQPWEEKYEAMAIAMGIDPKTKKYVPFTPADQKFVHNWLNIVMKPLEEQGVDFWWLDWQQGEDWIDIPHVNPTFWLNHMFFTNPYHWKTERPLILHRFGGLGNHRYPLGFSGDVEGSWHSLNFQPYFTATASNILYGYWSHDIGGFYPGLTTRPELYTRWVQFGVFSPVFRTHCDKDSENYREIWRYPPEYYKIMKNAIILRASLVPYIYTAARRAHDTGLSILTPMYYYYPEEESAYTQKNQYMFGTNLMVHPITKQMDNNTQLAESSTWIPPNTHFVCLYTGKVFSGPGLEKIKYLLEEIPVFAKAGSIIPMAVINDRNLLGQAQKLPEMLKLLIVPGLDTVNSEDYMYEDDGSTIAYKNGEFSRTRFSLTKTLGTAEVIVHKVEGNFKGMLEHRSYEIHMKGVWPASKVSVNGDGISFKPFGYKGPENFWTYDGNTATLIVRLNKNYPTNEDLKVFIEFISPESTLMLQGFEGKMRRVLNTKTLLDDQWGIKKVFMDDYPNLLQAASLGMRIIYDVDRALEYVRTFWDIMPKVIEEVKVMPNLRPEIRDRILAQLLE